MLTILHLRTIMPALPATKAATFFPFLEAAMGEFDVGSPARIAAFLAQLAHESGQFRFMEEIWGPTTAQRRYEPPTTLAARLGNTEPGDGKRFKGRGPIQITGRDNYRRYGELLGVDLLANPAHAARPELAFRIAGLFWQRNGLNELADVTGDAAFTRITRRINGGVNGLADRRRFYAVACQVLGVVPTGAESGAHIPGRLPSFGRGAESVRSDSRGRRPATSP